MGLWCKYLAKLLNLWHVVVFWPKIRTFMDTFGTTISWNHQDTIFVLIYVTDMASNGAIYGWERTRRGKSGEPIRHLFCVEKIDQQGPNAILIPKFWYLWPNVKRPNTMHWTYLEICSVSEIRILFWGSSRILAIIREWCDRRASNLNFGKLAPD